MEYIPQNPFVKLQSRFMHNNKNLETVQKFIKWIMICSYNETKLIYKKDYILSIQ